jgi:uncharacterized membrane protein HdeD (DUF308 family)
MNMASPVAPTLALVIAKHWWVLLVRGLLSIGFGVVALLWPGLTLASLVLLYGAYCFAEGLVAFMGGYGRKLWQSMLVGFISIAAGLAAVMYPGLTAIVLLYLVGCWSIVRGIAEIATAIEFRKVIQSEWLLGFAGVGSIVFGILVILFPGAGALSLIWLLAAYAIIFGVVLAALSFRVRSVARTW